MPNELEKIISAMSNAEKAQFAEKTRLAMLLLKRVTPHISETAKLIAEQRDEEKSTKRIWTGLWIIMGAIFLLHFINVADEKWFYYPGVYPSTAVSGSARSGAAGRTWWGFRCSENPAQPVRLPPGSGYTPPRLSQGLFG